MNNAKPKVILITGAARRIGKKIAEFLHEQGMQVLIHCHHSQELAQSLCQTLNQKRANSAAVVVGDLAKIEDLNNIVNQALAVWGYIDALVNNASGFYATDLGEVEESQWQDLMDVNLKAPFFLSQLLAPSLKKRQGCIVNISDIHGSRPLRHYPVYSITKAGLNMLTMTLAKELAPEVRVNAIAPGVIFWPEGQNEQQEERQQEIVSRVALKKIGNPLDIAKAVWFFLEAEYVTGQILAVDGGRLLHA